MYCLELALDIIYSLLFDDAGIGSTGTDSLANTATNITAASQRMYIDHLSSSMQFLQCYLLLNSMYNSFNFC